MLIKSVASVIPSYFMSFYSLPQSWCQEFDRVPKNFWWGYKDEQERHLSLKSWKSICIPKCIGGLGILGIK